MSVIVLGTVALDTIKTPFGRRRNILGGSAAHFAMSARLFTDVHLVAAVGEDFPRQHLLFLKRKGIILESLRKEKGRTFRWEGEYRGDLNTALTLRTCLGVLSTFQAQVSLGERKIKYLFLANVDPEIQERLLAKMRPPKLVGLDTMNFWIHHKRKGVLRVLKKADIFVANDQEIRALTQENNLIQAARSLQRHGPEVVLVKRGEHGVLVYTASFIFILPAYPLSKVIDPTGAGDTFAGGFFGYLAKVRKINTATLKKASAYAIVAASFNVQDFGLERTARLSLKDLNKRLAEFRKMVLF